MTVGFKADSPDDDGIVGIAAVGDKNGVFGYNPADGGNEVAGISDKACRCFFDEKIRRTI
jgi:hypothetical protein